MFRPLSANFRELHNKEYTIMTTNVTDVKHKPSKSESQLFKPPPGKITEISASLTFQILPME